MAKTLQQKHELVRFILDEQAVYKPLHDAKREAIRDLLQFCLWQAGIASGALVLLVSASGEIVKTDQALLKGGLAVAMVSDGSLAPQHLPDNASYYHSTLESLNYETKISAELVTSMLHVLPKGLDGELSTEQALAIEKHEKRQEENADLESKRIAHLHELVRTQTKWFYVMIGSMAYLVVGTATVHLIDWGGKLGIASLLRLK